MENIFNNAGFGLILLGSLLNNILHLRISMLFGNIFLIVWGNIIIHDLATVFWSSAFVALHLYHICKIKYFEYQQIQTIT